MNFLRPSLGSFQQKTGLLQSITSPSLAPTSIIHVSSRPFSPKLLELYFQYLPNHIDLGCLTFVNTTAQDHFMYKWSNDLKTGLAVSILVLCGAYSALLECLSGSDINRGCKRREVEGLTLNISYALSSETEALHMLSYCFDYQVPWRRWHYLHWTVKDTV